MSKKQINGRAYETQTGDKEHHFDYCFEFDTITKSRFVRIYFNRLSKFKRLPLVIIQNIKKKVMKMYILVIFFSLLRNRTNQKNFDRKFKI